MPYYGRDEPVLADSRPGSKDATHLLPLQQHTWNNITKRTALFCNELNLEEE